MRSSTVVMGFEALLGIISLLSGVVTANNLPVDCLQTKSIKCGDKIHTTQEFYDVSNSGKPSYVDVSNCNDHGGCKGRSGDQACQEITLDSIKLTLESNTYGTNPGNRYNCQA